MVETGQRNQEMTNADVSIEEGSTNVFADLGYADAAEMQRKASLASEIARGIKARHLTQDAASHSIVRNRPGQDLQDHPRSISWRE